MKVKLGDICSFQSGGTPSRKRKEYFNGDIPWITTVALNGKTVDENDAVEMISDVAIRESAAKIVPQKSIMIGTRVGVGKVAMNMVPMATNQDIISAVGIDEQQWDKEYIVKLISSKQELLKSESRGATIKGIKLDILKKIEIPNIPIEKQRAISLIFNRLDKTIERQEQQKYLLDQLVKSRFIEMFGDPVKNTMRWEVVTFSEIFRMIKSGLSRKLSDDDIGLPMIRSKNIVKGVLDPSDLKYWHINDPQGADTNEYILDDGDILVNFINSSSQIGKGCIFHDIGRPCIYTTNCFRIKLKSDCNEIYFNSYMMTEGYYRQIQSIIQPAVNQASFTTKNYLQLKIPLPPLSLQNQFADFVAQVDKSKLAIQKSLDQLETLKKSLMQDYFG